MSEADCAQRFLMYLLSGIGGGILGFSVFMIGLNIYENIKLREFRNRGWID